MTVNDVDEPGTITLNRLQPQVGVALTASFTDPDRGTTDTAPTNVVWEWTVPKLSRPDINNDAHWQAPAATANAEAYTPATVDGGADDAGNILRVKVTYDDQQGTGKKLLMLSYHPVRAAVDAADNNDPEFANDLAATITVAEDVPEGRIIGTFAASDANSGDILTYVLGGAGAGSFDIDMRTGQVTVDGELSFETPGPDYVLEIQAFDPSGQSDTHNLTVTTTNVNEAPTVAGPSTGTIEEITAPRLMPTPTRPMSPQLSPRVTWTPTTRGQTHPPSSSAVMTAACSTSATRDS